MPSVISGDANVSATEFGFLDGVTSALQSQIDSKLPLAGGKILQIVRATDATERTTSSTSFVDVTGMSVTITPQKSDSAILIIAAFRGQVERIGSVGTQLRAFYAITDSSNNILGGTAGDSIGLGSWISNGIVIGATFESPVTMIRRDTPATTSPVEYKLRFSAFVSTNSAKVQNDLVTGQMYAIEVSA